MGKIISEGLLKPNDPIFSGGVETFSIRKPKAKDEHPRQTGASRRSRCQRVADIRSKQWEVTAAWRTFV